MELWPSLAVIAVLFLAFVILLWHSAIDLKLRLLPDELTAALILLGLAFHWAAYPYSIAWQSILSGALVGGGALALVRAVANRIYGFETMGLGDVKLLATFGVWLGPEGVLYALIIGALAGVLHGIGLMVYCRIVGGPSVGFRDMTVPAGPGFCFGALAAAAWQYQNLPFFGAGS